MPHHALDSGDWSPHPADTLPGQARRGGDKGAVAVGDSAMLEAALEQLEADLLNDAAASSIQQQVTARQDARLLAQFCRERLEEGLSHPPDDSMAQLPREDRKEEEPPAVRLPRNRPHSTAIDLYGSQFGDYELLDEIARGGMGIVFRAWQISANRVVALKMILAGRFATSEDRQRFRTEVEAAANLDHPNIVPIYEAGDQNGRHYFTMKLIEGGSLAQHLPKFKDEPHRSAALLATVARAIHYAHQRGILHRDLKPANILLDAVGQPHVSDFSLAKLVERDEGVTREGIILGTPSYMAPEQATGAKIATTTSADVYSLGAILYEILTGRPPFVAESPLATLMQATSKDPEPPSRLNPNVPRELESVCLKCLEKEPADRYSSAHELADELTRYVNNESLRVCPLGMFSRGKRWCRRNRSLSAVTGLAIVLLAAGTSLAITFVVHQSRATAYLRAERERTLQALAATEGQRHLVDQLRQEAKAQKLAADRLAAIQALDMGLALCEQGEVGRGLLWLARSLELAPSEASDLQWVIRANLAGWGRRLQPARGPSPYQRMMPPDNSTLLGSLDGKTRDAPIDTPLRHMDRIVAVAFNSTGNVVATASWDRTARIWDASTGEPLGPPMQHHDRVTAVAFSPDGKLVLTASRDRTARLWSVATGKPIGPPMRYQDDVLAVGFDPKSAAVITTRSDGASWVWEQMPPVEGDAKHVLLWAQTLTGMQLDAGGGAVMLDGETQQQHRLRWEETSRRQ